MPSNSASDQTRIANEQRAWALRQRGWTQQRIADDIGVDQGTICRWLDKIERRELARLSKNVEAMKVRQTGVLESILDETLQAWERSKKPKRKGTTRTASGRPILGTDGHPIATTDETKVSEAIERDGEPAFLDRALIALRDLRRLWGIDAPERRQEESGGGFTVADLAARLRANAARHDEVRAKEEAPESDGRSVD